MEDASQRENPSAPCYQKPTLFVEFKDGVALDNHCQNFIPSLPVEQIPSYLSCDWNDSSLTYDHLLNTSDVQCMCTLTLTEMYNVCVHLPSAK